MINHYQYSNKPALTPIKNGWAAHGEGWAVHALTPEQAIQKFFEAEQRHREIDKLPFRYEQSDTQLANEHWHR